jgi:hypothetical protein
MSSNNEPKRSKAPPPPFSGNVIPYNFAVKRDDIGEEVSRRIAGVVAFQPNFEPMTESSVPVKVAATYHAAKPSVKEGRIGSPKPLWDLRDVPTLPEFHPLERTAVFVPSAYADGVAERICRVLRERSIEATYDNAKAKARCVTAEGVDFRIRMYRGRGKFSHGIIVEVQRRFGSSINFHSDTMAILDAAEGKTPLPPSTDALPLVSDSEDDFEPRSSSLTMVSKLLKHPGYDAHYLALQTLSSLTDSAKVGRGTALKISKALLESNGEIGNKLAQIVCDSKQDEDETFGLRLMAMSILANAFQVTAGRVPLDLREELRPTLLDELRRAKSNPRMALMAAKCVEYIIPGDHNISEIHGVLEVAREVGSARHLALMRQADLCIEKIESTR